jgi:uncharacterized ferritin-like protein (DUF455 family)
MIATPDWKPFRLAAPGEHADAPRSISSFEGMSDRLRAAAFAEIQAFHAFQWAASHFEDAPPSLRNAWRGLALAEERHLSWLLKRMTELNISVNERKVSDQLWVSLQSCKTAKEFALYMASAEERGRKAGERFYKEMKDRDAITAEIFRKIAEEEVEHIALAARYFPEGKDDGTFVPAASSPPSA